MIRLAANLHLLFLSVRTGKGMIDLHIQALEQSFHYHQTVFKPRVGSNLAHTIVNFRLRSRRSGFSDTRVGLR
ncbi:hypothetical protein BJ912DRAFT_693165 [Pholiota molesta]|nr:hypothetical protein BJ912DRAFT_693165 [Pholiota molesta]